MFSRHTISRATLAAAVALIASLLVIPAPASALTVYAATSLTRVMPKIDRGPRYAFGGSNVLQLQIERGAPADLFLSASPQEAQALFRAGRCERPVTFTTNTLVLIARQGDPKRIRSRLRAAPRRAATVDRQRSGADRRLHAPAAARAAAEPACCAPTASRRSRTSARSSSQVAFGGADAGFVYRSDALPQLARVDLLTCRAARSRRSATRAASCAARVRRSAAARSAARRAARRPRAAGCCARRLRARGRAEPQYRRRARRTSARDSVCTAVPPRGRDSGLSKLFSSKLVYNVGITAPPLPRCLPCP